MKGVNTGSFKLKHGWSSEAGNVSLRGGIRRQQDAVHENLHVIGTCQGFIPVPSPPLVWSPGQALMQPLNVTSGDDRK